MIPKFAASPSKKILRAPMRCTAVAESLRWRFICATDTFAMSYEFAARLDWKWRA